MAKRRKRTVDNPLRLDHVDAIRNLPSVDRSDREPPRSQATNERGSGGVKQTIEVTSAQVDVDTDSSALKGVAAAPRHQGGESAGARSQSRIFEKRDPNRFAQRREQGGGAKDTYQLKTRFSPHEAAEIDEFRRGLESRLQVKLNGSQITRALWTLALRAEEEFSSVRAPSVKRPAWGDALSMAEFEDQIAEYLLSALKRTRR